MDCFKHSQTPPEILSVQTAAQTAVFEVQSLDLRFSNGETRTYERLTPSRRPAVMILPLHEQHLLLVREYAVASERYELGFSKGLIDPGETPEQAANRELQEEIGFGAHKLTLLRTIYTSPSHMYAPMYVFVAQDLYPQSRSGDEPEPLQTVRLPLTDIDRLLADERFAESKSLSALFLLQRFLRSQPTTHGNTP